MLGISFDELLSRADDETLQSLVGQQTVRLLNSLDTDLARPRNLRGIVTELHTPEDILRDQRSRQLLLGLMRSENARELCDELGLSTSDPFRSLLTAKVKPYSATEHTLLSYFGITQSERPPGPPTNALETATANYALFAHQRRAQREVLEKLHSPKGRVLLHMPTGAGKTRTAVHVIADELRSREPTVAIWLAYSEELCEQAASEFETAWSYLGDRDVDLYRFWGPGRNLEISQVRDGFMVAGLAKVYQRAKRDGDFLARLADRSTLVVIDEAHQAIAETYRFVLDYLVERNPRSSLLGLTATPGRTWNDPAQDEELAAFFRRQKVTLSVEGYENPIDYLIAERYLAEPQFEALNYEPREGLDSRQLQQLAENLDVPESVLQLLAADDQRNMVIVAAVERLLRLGHTRVLVFAATVPHTRLLATVLQARGINSDSVTGESSPANRQRIITRYKNNDPEPMVLCNYGVLTTGFDAPRTSAAVIARPTKSLVLFSQMVGRATRGERAGGNKTADIMTVVDTHLPGFGDMAEAFTNWEDVWE